MITRTYTFVLLLVAAVPLWSQRDAVPTSEPAAAANDSQMLVPPPVFGSGQVSPVTVFAPVADQLSNTGAAQLRYQFGLNAMVGVSGTFTNLHYSNPAEVPGLYDSGSRGGSVFYTHRLSGRHYIGATYEYQMLLAYPVGFRAQPQSNGVTMFYS